MDAELIATGQASRLLEMSTTRVRELAQSGELPAVGRVGDVRAFLFRRDDVLAFRDARQARRRVAQQGPISAA